ncbi:MAG: D-alanyl-D-alanine dipeptidase [Bacillota bacterium]
MGRHPGRCRWCAHGALFTAAILAVGVLLAVLATGCSRLAARRLQPTANPPKADKPPVVADPPTADKPPIVADPSTTADPPVPLKEIEGLVDVTALDDTFVIDLRYATADNFTGQAIYSKAKCLLQRATAEKLLEAQKEFAGHGYRIKIWDAYRPLSAQKTLWEVVGDPAFVADPAKGSIHNRGAAVDVTLVDQDGNEMPMPTGFDDFSEKAAIDYDGCTLEQARNRDFLAEVMVKHGFVRYRAEWWHFVDEDGAQYPLLDVSFEEFE